MEQDLKNNVSIMFSIKGDEMIVTVKCGKMKENILIPDEMYVVLLDALKEKKLNYTVEVIDHS